jgi:hypothetical protein
MAIRSRDNRSQMGGWSRILLSTAVVFLALYRNVWMAVQSGDSSLFEMSVDISNAARVVGNTATTAVSLTSTNSTLVSKPQVSHSANKNIELPIHLKQVANLNLTLVYVRVGKTGGNTLNSVLRSNCRWYTESGKRTKCLRALDDDADSEESAVSKVTKATTHVRKRKSFKTWIKESNGFLITVRNPVGRVVSAFNMEHPRNTVRKVENLNKVHKNFQIFYLECFPTVEHLAQKLFAYSQKHDEEDKECYDRGSKILRGQGNPFVASHLKANYGHYAKYTFGKYPDRSVLVARTEHLWDDMKVIDQSLGGSGVFLAAGSVATHGSEKYVVSDGLSQFGKEVVCCYIASDISIYENLVRRAVNLSPSEKEETMAQVYNDCGLTNSSLVAGNTVALERFRPAGASAASFSWEEWAKSSESGCPQ